MNVFRLCSILRDLIEHRLRATWWIVSVRQQIRRGADNREGGPICRIGRVLRELNAVRITGFGRHVEAELAAGEQAGVDQYQGGAAHIRGQGV